MGSPCNLAYFCGNIITFDLSFLHVFTFSIIHIQQQPIFFLQLLQIFHRIGFILIAMHLHDLQQCLFYIITHRVFGAADVHRCAGFQPLEYICTIFQHLMLHIYFLLPGRGRTQDSLCLIHLFHTSSAIQSGRGNQKRNVVRRRTASSYLKPLLHHGRQEMT